MSYSFHKNNYKFDDLNDGVSFPNNKDIRHAISFAATYNHNNLKLAFGLNWHTGKPTTLPSNTNGINNNAIDYELPNEERLSDYLRTDLSANYQFKLDKATDAVIGFSVWNLLDKENIINNYFIRDNANVIQSIENKSLGITPNVSFRVRF